MSENTARSEEQRVSRLDLVRSGAANTGALKVPKRGRFVVDMASLVPDPKNERKSFLRISELAATIREVGIIDPPTVVPLEDGRYMITTGERRYRAAKEAGLKQIPVIIGDAENERVRRTKSLVSNIQREDLSVLELSQALQDMKDDAEVKTNRQLAQRIGKSEQWVGQILKVLELPESTIKKIRSAERPISYDSIIEIARVEDPKAQNELLKSALSGATVKEVREQARGTKSRRAGKPRAQSTQKIATAKGWVIVHCSKKGAKRADYVAALAEAIKTARKLEL